MGNPVIETCRHPDQSLRQLLFENLSNFLPWPEDTNRGQACKLNLANDSLPLFRRRLVDFSEDCVDDLGLWTVPLPVFTLNQAKIVFDSVWV